MGFLDLIRVCPYCKKGVKVGISLKCPECAQKTIMFPTEMPNKPIDAWTPSVWKDMNEEDKQSSVQTVLDAYSNSTSTEPVESWEYDRYITTTPNFENFQIENYFGVVSGTDIYLIGGALGGGLITQENLFNDAFLKAKKQMIGKAMKMGGNAVVGMSFAVSHAMEHTVLVVTGTAVKVNF